MLEWKIFDERTPLEKEAPSPLPPRRTYRWAVVGVSLLLVGLGIWYLRHLQEAHLQADIAEVVLLEERAIRAGAVGEATRLADPTAPAEWLEGYQASFRWAGTVIPEPKTTILALEDHAVLVKVTYESETLFWQTLRAYRLVEGQWRRTPIDGFLQDEPRRIESGPSFLLRGSQEEARFIREHPECWVNLGRLREQLLASWEGSCDHCFLSLTLQQQEFAPLSTFTPAQSRHLSLRVISPLLFQPDWSSPLPPASQYRLAVAETVVRALATPDGLPVVGWGQEMLSRDGLAFLTMLQQAEARQLALEERERRALRNRWRAELDGRWPTPFEGALSLSPETLSGTERHRWLTVNLLLEKEIARGGTGTPARLAHMVLSYPASSFGWERFFQALIGGSLDDLETLSRDYVLTMEP